jgi:hypothetical protein
MFLKSDFGDPDEIALAAAIRQRRQPTEGGIVKRVAEAIGNAREDFRPAGAADAASESSPKAAQAAEG